MCSRNPSIYFEDAWRAYPKRLGKKAALRHYIASVHSFEDHEKLMRALENYKKSDTFKRGWIQNGSTWFNNWQDWVDYVEPDNGTSQNKHFESTKKPII